MEAELCANDTPEDAKADEVCANLASKSVSPARLCAIVGRTMAIVKPRLMLGHELVVARQALNMSQREFGPALGASHRTASPWDAGKSRPTEASPGGRP
jgi:DNA-binding transcriptional regulator YiaG